MKTMDSRWIGRNGGFVNVILVAEGERLDIYEHSPRITREEAVTELRRERLLPAALRSPDGREEIVK